MSVTIRRFNESDIPLKVRWINDNVNNTYLHYELPLEEENTMKWFKTLKDKGDRADFTILYNDEPVGIIGVLNIDHKNKKAEYYITVGEIKYKNKGIAFLASKLLINYAKEEFRLNKLYLFTETENYIAQNLFEKVGFVKEGLLNDDLIHNGKKINRFVYGLFLNK